MEGLWSSTQIHWGQKQLHGCQLRLCQLTILRSDPVHNQSEFLLLQAEDDLGTKPPHNVSQRWETAEVFGSVWCYRPLTECHFPSLYFSLLKISFSFPTDSRILPLETYKARWARPPLVAAKNSSPSEARVLTSKEK